MKTSLGLEKLVASRIEEFSPHLKAVPSPLGFKGLILVYGCRDVDVDAEKVLDEVVEADRVLRIHAVAKASIDEMSRAASIAASRFFGSESCFAVRTTRRGRHSFTSIDVNVAVGDSIRRSTGACVNLSNPDWVVAVEIIQDLALISVYRGAEEWRKMRGKHPVLPLLRKISVVQMPYLGPLDACRNMGVRVGREVQNFEVGELVVAPSGLVDARQLLEFLAGVFEGVESRFEIQRKSYHRKVWRVPVYLQDIHQLVRSRKGEPIIVMEPEGEHISRKVEELWDLFRNSRRVNILIGSREGIPLGVYRFADIVVDLAPGITLSTDYAAAAALTAIATLLYERASRLDEERENG
ncbi:MAG: SPOUT family RNA methylase [Aeropyrum sp.]|nr:SPOUT family RNA methylase [Aeropyrum sp.]MCE4616080.1 SPOUT family RNA methylase [Aeropyrum sp.]